MQGLALLVVGLCVASCVKEDKSSSISEIVHEREALDGRHVFVHGYIEVDAMDYPNFVEERGPPRGDRITKSIDLVPHDAQVEKKLVEYDGACVVVDGKFHLYGPNEVRLGNLVSMYGQVVVKSIHRCDG
jgi:hypothetical protein